MISQEDQDYLKHIYNDRKKAGDMDDLAFFELLYCLAKRLDLPFSQISDIAHKNDYATEASFIRLAHSFVDKFK